MNSKNLTNNNEARTASKRPLAKRAGLLLCASVMSASALLGLPSSAVASRAASFTTGDVPAGNSKEWAHRPDSLITAEEKERANYFEKYYGNYFYDLSANYVLTENWGRETPSRAFFVIDPEIFKPSAFGSWFMKPLNYLSSSVGKEEREHYTRSFVQALSDEKPVLMAIYRLDNVRYNKLAALAFGILGQESHFYQAYKFDFKERYPDFVRILKLSRGISGFGDRLSKGATQMKYFPEKLVHWYTEHDAGEGSRLFSEAGLSDPRVAAIATVGYLAEAMPKIMEIARNAQQSADVASADSLEIGAAKAASAVLAQQSQRVNALEIDDNTVITYLLYYYDGRAKQITSGDATPGSNRYIKSVSEFMKHLALYEDVKDNWSYVRSNESISDQRVSPEYRPQPSVKYRFGGFRNLCIQGLNESQKRKNEVAVWAVCN